MSTIFSVIGGDLRIVELIKLLTTEDNKVYVYGIEKTEKINELKENKKIIICNNLQEAVQNSSIVIGPIPFTIDGEYINTPFSDMKLSILELLSNINGKMLIAGSIKKDIIDMACIENIEIIDVMTKEELAILNAISTVEGAIQIAISNTEKVIHGSKVLILGFGRIGKVLAKKLEGLSANVTCTARKKEDLAWIKAYGYKGINIMQIEDKLPKYDIIINTVPHLILDEEKLKNVRNDCLLIDLASKPGGIDFEFAKKKNIKVIWALALPGKVAPITSAEIIKETVYNILEK